MLNRIRADLRIVLAIAGKDVADAIKSKSIQSVMLGILLMALSGRALPLVLGLSDAQTVVYYDPDRSRTWLALRKQEGIRLAKVSSPEEAAATVASAADVRLGVVLPAGWEEKMAGGQAAPLTAYAVHWARPAEIEARRAALERALGEAAGRPVEVSVAERRLYPSPEGEGFAGMGSRMVILVTITVGMFLVPYLIGDERQQKTMDALLVSPARIGQIVRGKALAGAVYCLVTGGIALAFHGRPVVHWPVALLALCAATLLAVALGLLLGSLFRLPQNANAAAGALLALLLAPLYLGGQIARLGPAAEAALRLLPSRALDAALQLALVERVPAAALWGRLGVALGVSALLYALTAWVISREDR